MLEEILIAGFGGQGVIFAGRLLSEAALAEDKQVACAVSYGPEMRGGTANCSVILSDEPIGSLVVTHPTVAIIMNEPSMVKFEPRVGKGGLIIVNQSLVRYQSQRQDITALYIPATDLAMKMGNKAIANVILIGVLLSAKPVVAANTVSFVLEKILGKEQADLLKLNQQALRLGIVTGEYIKQAQTASGGEK